MPVSKGAVRATAGAEHSAIWQRGSLTQERKKRKPRREGGRQRGGAAPHAPVAGHAAARHGGRLDVLSAAAREVHERRLDAHLLAAARHMDRDRVLHLHAARSTSALTQPTATPLRSGHFIHERAHSGARKASSNTGSTGRAEPVVARTQVCMGCATNPSDAHTAYRSTTRAYREQDRCGSGSAIKLTAAVHIQSAHPVSTSKHSSQALG